MLPVPRTRLPTGGLTTARSRPRFVAGDKGFEGVEHVELLEGKAPMILENDPANGCWGCGPANPANLGLTFAREGDTVVCERAFSERETGWPGFMHTGLLFTAMFETAYWTVLGLTDRLSANSGEPASFAVRRLPRDGAAARCVGRIMKEDDEGWNVRVEATSAGKPCATLDVRMRRVSAEGLAKAGVTLPEHLREHLG